MRWLGCWRCVCDKYFDLDPVFQKKILIRTHHVTKKKILKRTYVFKSVFGDLGKYV